MKKSARREVSFINSIFYIIVSIFIISLEKLLSKNTTIKLSFTFSIVAILSYVLAFKIISPSFNSIKLGKLLFQVIPLFIGIIIVTSFILKILSVFK
ncbi:hypothetical protein [Clostridium septicum]|uniref:Uncharacterized protein n=1 Tax=Clostridium septicum TaxID=1504 RepID=A0A9N7JJN7_CLOSE|nr:hypothetical protein [Clostridium septicum]AYE33853.1 hypothetical protein CP523_04875 [Clostridium septicum]MDU1314076.1 hypothetical protein [Clostridium septicum]QAS61999.1 hypothetical protein EI377_15390 [Clostridium septicum]UEC21536.1 hypothetical protein LK444_03955 [Clostridium septicum]USS00418.1 hypothetical protein NH397_13130 [Clostridium septicum]